MDNFIAKDITVSRGLEYRYYTSPRISNGTNSPTLLLLHGFRDTASCWRFMAPGLSKIPCQLLIPDLLGHGASSKPTDPAKYAYHLMAKDMCEILDAEDVKNVVLLGHDHGSGLSSRIYNYFPSRVTALITLNVTYSPPSKTNPLNLDAINAWSRQTFGYGILEYWNFLTSPDAASVMNANLDRVWEIAHTNSFEEMRHLFGDPGAMRAYLTDSSIPSVNVKPYARDPKLKDEWKKQFEKSGLAAPLCFYTSHFSHTQHDQTVQFASDQLVPDETIVVKVPVLFIGCDSDAPCRTEMIDFTKKASLLPDLTVQILEGVGHWPMYERPEEVVKIVETFLWEEVDVSR